MSVVKGVCAARMDLGEHWKLLLCLRETEYYSAPILSVLQ